MSEYLDKINAAKSEIAAKNAHDAARKKRDELERQRVLVTAEAERLKIIKQATDLGQEAVGLLLGNKNALPLPVFHRRKSGILYSAKSAAWILGKDFALDEDATSFRKFGYSTAAAKYIDSSEPSGVNTEPIESIVDPIKITDQNDILRRLQSQEAIEHIAAHLIGQPFRY